MNFRVRVFRVFLFVQSLKHSKCVPTLFGSGVPQIQSREEALHTYTQEAVFVHAVVSHSRGAPLSVTQCRVRDRLCLRTPGCQPSAMFLDLRKNKTQENSKNNHERRKRITGRTNKILVNSQLSIKPHPKTSKCVCL